MTRPIDRRDFLRLAGCGGAVFASGLATSACATHGTEPAPDQDFYFVQLSDTHWGYEGAANPDALGSLPKAIAAVNALAQAPDFVVFTGDLTHLTPDGAMRRARMTRVRELAASLQVKDLRFLPGEHDASLDHGQAYREFFGPTHYAFDHKGVHFIALDNVSDPRGALGEEQLAWLADDLARQEHGARIVVLAHRPLFDLAPQWGWATLDGQRALALLEPYEQVSVFYGHIHQAHEHRTGRIAHYGAQSLIFPLPPPGSPDHRPVAWNAEQPYRGLGWREVEPGRTAAGVELHAFELRA